MATCHFCRRAISRATSTKMVEARRQPDGGTAYNNPFEKETGAKGPIIWAAHYKCYKVAVKKEGNLAGNVGGSGMPTVYEIMALAGNQDELRLLGITEEEARTHTTEGLASRVSDARREALEQGTGGGDWRQKERQRALKNGGPYEHVHIGHTESFRLPSHLEFAHGFAMEDIKDILSKEATQLHEQDHAKRALARTIADRQADPGYQDPGLGDSDWRYQQVLEVSQVPLPPK